MDANHRNAKPELVTMTWREAEAAFKANPVILIPMGSIEEHGPQTPVGDYRYMAEVARRIAANTGAIALPTIPWGYSEYFKHFPGCLTLRPETLKAILFDLLDCLTRFNLTRFVFVCGHKGDMPILEQVARDMLDRGVRIATIEPISWLGQDYLRRLYGDNTAVTGHGSDPMASIALHLFPDECRMDLIEPGNPGMLMSRPVKGMSAVEVDGFMGHLYCNMEEAAPNGVLGDVSHASAEVGRQCVERMVEGGTRFVEWFANQLTRKD